jgi:endogenous inhibitor of DNA gyrase (YacG/DUF329 family)
MGMSLTTSDKESLQDGICPRCGAECAWEFADVEQTSIEVVCPDCERYHVSKAEFEQAQADVAEAEAQAEE